MIRRSCKRCTGRDNREGGIESFLRPLVIGLVIITADLLAISAHAQTKAARVRYGNYPVHARGLAQLKRDLLQDKKILRANKNRCRDKKSLKKLPVCDADSDGITNGRERMLGTSPFDKDTDRDGLTDPQELLKFHTDPRRVDTDGNGIWDGDEDSNGNGISDEDEDDKPGEGSTYEDLNDAPASNGCPATNFDTDGNTVLFGIPAPNIGNITRGELAFNQTCKLCHIAAEPGTNFAFAALKTRLSQAPMFITTLANSKLADLVAYLNRTQTGLNTGCNPGEPSPSPGPPPTDGSPTPSPTPTPIGTACANQYFDAEGNTIQFGIPAPLVGNYIRGSSYSSLHCNSCHGDRGAAFSFAQLKSVVTGPLMNISTVTDQDFADLTANANKSLANVGCNGAPTPTPNPATPTPTSTPSPTPTALGCSNQYFDVNGNTTQFGIPSPLVGNINQGGTLFSLGCSSHHATVEPGANFTFTQLKTAVTGPLMNIQSITDQQFANITAYLNRSSAPQNCGSPSPTPTPLDDISAGRLVYQGSCQSCHSRINSDLRQLNATKFREAVREVSQMKGITLTNEQLRVLIVFLRQA